MFQNMFSNILNYKQTNTKCSYTLYYQNETHTLNHINIFSLKLDRYNNIVQMICQHVIKQRPQIVFLAITVNNSSFFLIQKTKKK